MINRTLVEARLSLLLDLISQLDSLALLSEDEFLKDTVKAAAAESFLRRSLEAVFDVGRHILAKSGHSDMAKEYKGIANGLGSLGIVPNSLTQTLVKLAGYRNRLVQFYHQVSPEELFGILVARRDDLRRFVDLVVAYLESSQPEQ